MDLRLELVIIPVTDIDRAKAFYVDKAGFVADHDHRVDENLRFVQMTPVGSGCSIAFGQGLTDAEPGSVKGLQLVTDDIEATKKEFESRGLDAGEIQDLPWGRFLFFTDPDGNAWAVQAMLPRT
ncbi:glyoxalase superfamily protein [Jatrophihabitans telluris]|uniref:Glyoxalase superfamily protein n=1 Tax=Jatrophihabitans telluris TaxID=2038343 RepID=A0ABY4QYH9_9ACTN|nr:glyoxalase superfamily protein [Jatrophihabitans telluris]UQX87975.1 glyoxalase superfamily protein [Jatrophihabitans telluris]